MRHVNFKSDFKLEQRLYIEDPTTNQLIDIGFPVYNFKLKYWTTSPSNFYIASCTYEKKRIIRHHDHHVKIKGGLNEKNCEHYESEYDEYEVHMVNCRNENGTIVVLFEHHNLACGELKVEITLDLPDDFFPCGYKKEVIPGPTDAILWNRPTDGYSRVESRLILPYIKGKDFSYDDLTDEQKKDLAEQIGGSILEVAKQNTEEFFANLPEYEAEDILEALKDMEEFKDIKPEDITT